MPDPAPIHFGAGFFVAGFARLVGFGWRIQLSFTNGDPHRLHAKRRGKRDAMKIWSKLQNPFALVAQGFAIGGLVFWTTRADAAALLSVLHLSF